eukprot:1282641-Rhodomonas_salina.2
MSTWDPLGQYRTQQLGQYRTWRSSGVGGGGVGRLVGQCERGVAICMWRQTGSSICCVSTGHRIARA